MAQMGSKVVGDTLVMLHLCYLAWVVASIMISALWSLSSAAPVNAQLPGGCRAVAPARPGENPAPWSHMGFNIVSFATRGTSVRR